MNILIKVVIVNNKIDNLNIIVKLVTINYLSRRAMDKNIQTLKSEQEKLRVELLQVYSSQGKSLVEISKSLEIPYSSLRRFLWGGGFNMKNIMKINNLLNKKIPTVQD